MPDKLMDDSGDNGTPEGRMPLAGYRVLDLTRVISGPFSTMLLGDMGAEVIKIETPHDGDPIRQQGAIVHGLSYYFATFNRNKKSITLNLKHADGRRLFERLVSEADVVIDNFRPGVLDRLGLSRTRLREIRPNLIFASISGFGETGPYRDRPSFDFIAQAMSGFMSMNGTPEQPPLRSGLPISDLIAGLYTALGVVAALLRRDRTGAGEVVTTSLTAGLISFLSYAASHYFATGQVLQRSGNDHPITSPYGLFATSDGVIAIAPANDEFFERLVRVLGLGAELSRPEFSTNTLRLQNRSHINKIITRRLSEHCSDDWVQMLNAAGVPSGPVYRVDQVFVDPQFSDMSIDVPRSGHQPIRMIGFPLTFADSPCIARHGPPELGEHNDEVLLRLGLTPEEVADLRTRKVI
jgi:CoA:oxalate CoA-transferase